MPPTAPLDRFVTALAVMRALLAHHCAIARIAGPLPGLIWNRWRAIERQVCGILSRLQAGTLRRYPNRRKPVARAAPRRPAAPSPFPSPPGWLPRTVPGVGMAAGTLHELLHGPDFPALLQAAPQLRRALRPLCRMLGVQFPRPPLHPAQPTQPAAARPMLTAPGRTPRPPPPELAWPSPPDPPPAQLRNKPA